jgi:hypothetical protein
MVRRRISEAQRWQIIGMHTTGNILYRYQVNIRLEYIYNTCALSKHIGNTCMRLRNGCFAPNTHIYLYASTVHMYCIYPGNFCIVERNISVKIDNMHTICDLNHSANVSSAHIGGYCFQIHTQNYFKYFYHRPTLFLL